MRLERWVQRADWKAYDTFDGLSSPLARALTFGRPFLKQVWQQGVRRFPLNLRPLLGIKPAMSSKAMGFFAQGYLKLYQIYGEPEYLEKIRFCLDWLTAHRNPGFRGSSWGNHFDYQHRAGSIPRGTPTIVWTGLIGHAFLDAYETLGDAKYLDVAQSICEFIATEIGHDELGDALYLRYYPGSMHLVHNSNVIGGSLLARLDHHRPNVEFARMSRLSIRFTVKHQLANGAWYYGVGPKFRWVDSFHTGYVLEAMHLYSRYSGDTEYDDSLKRGYAFFVETFFAANGTPRYYDRKARPLDIQCCSQGIQTLINLRRLHPKSVETAEKVARWTLDNMQDRDGHFYYRKYPFITNKTATMHWGQATMFAALATLEHYYASEGSVTSMVAAT
jgi:hypothetical protein